MGNKHVYTSEGKKGTQYGTQYIYNEGITKREYFASMAMQGLVTRYQNMINFESSYRISKDAIMLADALLKELEKEEK